MGQHTCGGGKGNLREVPGMLEILVAVKVTLEGERVTDLIVVPVKLTKRIAVEVVGAQYQRVPRNDRK